MSLEQSVRYACISCCSGTACSQTVHPKQSRILVSYPDPHRSCGWNTSPPTRVGGDVFHPQLRCGSGYETSRIHTHRLYLLQHRGAGRSKTLVRQMNKQLGGRRLRGWVREGVLPPPAQPGGMGGCCKLPHRGLGRSPRSFASCAFLMS